MAKDFLIGSLRIKHNLTQQQMANILKVNLKTYAKYENKKDITSLEILNKLSNYFNLSLDYLLKLNSNPKNINANNTINYRRLTFYLKFIRKQKRITQEDLAPILGVSCHTISKYENNAKSINALYLANFASFFNISVDFICGKNSTKKELR